MAQAKLCGLTPTQAKVLSSLSARNISGGRLSVPKTAADLGASRDSPHYGALRTLCERGYADRVEARDSGQPTYQLTPDGLGMLGLLSELVRIPAAMIQGPRDASERRLQPFAFLKDDK